MALLDSGKTDSLVVPPFPYAAVISGECLCLRIKICMFRSVNVRICMSDIPATNIYDFQG